MKEQPNGSHPRSSETEAPLTTGEMARLSSTTLRTVRFYEEAGILTPLGRTDGGHRLFDRTQLDRLMLVCDMREAGMSLEEIRHLLDAKAKAASGTRAAEEAIALLLSRLDFIEKKVSVLQRLSVDLQRTVTEASACLTCEKPAMFPNHCGECGKFDPNQVSRGMRVIWNLDSKRSRDSEPPPVDEPAAKDPEL